jgi:hypothetical protein
MLKSIEALRKFVDTLDEVLPRWPASSDPHA